MKKIISLLTILLAVFSVVGLAACNKATTKKNAATQALGVDADHIYSMNLSDIAGYENYVVVNGTWQETYDVIIKLAKSEGDATKRTKLYHKAEDLLMSTGCIVPLYYYTDLYMVKDNVTGFFSTASGNKFFKYCKVGGATTNISVCLASEPDTIDPAANSAVDGAAIILHCFSGLVTYGTDGSLVADLCKALPTAVANADGSVSYTFELRDNVKWSDGSDVTAQDFIYAWNRAADPAAEFDYGYLFEIIKGYGTEEGLALESLDGGKKLKVTLPVDVPYFFELCAFPTFMPVKETAVAVGGGWATAPATYVSNGAYTLTKWTHDSVMEFTKNPNYWDAANVTMEKITMYLSDDDAAILANYENGTYDFIDSLPNDEIARCKTTYASQLHIDGQLGTYYVIFNRNKSLLPTTTTLTGAAAAEANEEIRYALSLILDRNYIVEEIGQAGQVPASSFVGMGITNADGSEFYKTAGNNNNYIGYFDTDEDAYKGNCTEAVTILKKYYDYDENTKKFTNFPTFDYLYNNGSGHQAIGEYLQAAWKAYGIDSTLTNQEWATFLVTRKDGNFTVARNGWLADYNDPINMLDMWTSYSGNNDAQFGK